MAWNYNKYHNKKTIIDGITFDSKKEAVRYQELKVLESAGVIKDLQRQVKFVLIPAQREPDTVSPSGRKIRGSLIERECSYKADFVYTDSYGRTRVEDVKGVRTSEYRLKRKLMLYIHNIRIEEI